LGRKKEQRNPNLRSTNGRRITTFTKREIRGPAKQMGGTRGRDLSTMDQKEIGSREKKEVKYGVTLKKDKP